MHGLAITFFCRSKPSFVLKVVIVSHCDIIYLLFHLHEDVAMNCDLAFVMCTIATNNHHTQNTHPPSFAGEENREKNVLKTTFRFLEVFTQ